MNDPLKPPASLLCKLGSIAVHAEEGLNTNHPFDVIALRSVLADSEVQCWLTQMGSLSLIPLKRPPGKTGDEVKK